MNTQGPYEIEVSQTYMVGMNAYASMLSGPQEWMYNMIYGGGYRIAFEKMQEKGGIVSLGDWHHYKETGQLPNFLVKTIHDLETHVFGKTIYTQ